MKKFSLYRLIRILHRDIGYFFSSLVIIYCLSGIALNHVDDWNPDFIITKETVAVNENFVPETITKENILALSSLVGEKDYKVYDFPTPTQLKVYYDNATLHINFKDGTGVYEKLVRRPIFYESNVLHKNSLRGWKWASDVFAAMLILINITGLFVLKGKTGFFGRGKWFIAAGTLLPICAILIFEFIQK